MLITCSREELDQWEKWFIDLYDTFDTPHGLNLSSGGRESFLKSGESANKLRKPRTPETIAKIKATKRARKGTYVVSRETRDKIRASKIGKSLTAEAKLKLSIAFKGRQYSADSIARMRIAQSTRVRKKGYKQKPSLTRGGSVSKANKGNPNLHSVAKAVYCKDKDGVVLRFWSVKHTVEITGVGHTTVVKCCKTGHVHKGFQFSFTSEFKPAIYPKPIINPDRIPIYVKDLQGVQTFYVSLWHASKALRVSDSGIKKAAQRGWLFKNKYYFSFTPFI